MKNTSYNVYTLTLILCALSLSCASYATNRNFRRMRTKVKNRFNEEMDTFKSTRSIQQAEISYHEMENLAAQLKNLFIETTLKEKWQNIYNNLNQQWKDKCITLQSSKEYKENQFNDLKDKIKDAKKANQIKDTLILSVQRVVLAKKIAGLYEEQTEKRNWTDRYDTMRTSLLRTYNEHYENWNKKYNNNDEYSCKELIQKANYLLYFINTMRPLLCKKNYTVWKKHYSEIQTRTNELKESNMIISLTHG